MSDDAMFGQTLATWLEAEADHRVPDHLGEVLVRTAATGQRAWWSSPERWLPMDTTTSLGRRSSAPRAFLVFALLALLVAAIVGGALLTGAFQPTAPTLGPVTNGRIYVADGTSLVSYAADGTDRQLVHTTDAAATDLSFSPDGKRLAYVVPFPAHRIEILDIQSGTVTPIEFPTMTDLAGPLTWSPDGSRVAFTSTDGANEFIGTADTDGTGIHIIDTSAITPKGRWVAGWSPQGDQIAFVAADPDSAIGTLYVVRPDGKDMHPLSTKPVSTGTAGGPLWSPDPTQHLIAYETMVADALTLRVFDVDSGMDHNAGNGFWPAWSPQGDRISLCCAQVLRSSGILDGHVSPVQVFDPLTGYCQDNLDKARRAICSTASWSPDGTKLIAADVGGGGLLIAAADGTTATPIRIPIQATGSDATGPFALPHAWRPIFP